MADGHQITDPQAIKKFVLGGKAFFTLVSKKTGTRFTYKVAAPKDNDKILFVSVLCGPDNWSNYKYFGHLKYGEFHVGKKAKISAEAPAVQAFAWFWKNLFTCLEKMDFWHEGKCGKCGRKLTVPASIATGFGPDCAEMLGLMWEVPASEAQQELPGMDSQDYDEPPASVFMGEMQDHKPMPGVA